MSGGSLGWRDQQRLPNTFWDSMRNNVEKDTVYLSRSQNAIHLFKLLDERNGVIAKLAGTPVEKTHVRHILLTVSNITPEADVLRRLHSIRERIISGQADFQTMARLNSVDGSATRGGDLGWVQPGDLVPAFEQAMNKLNPGEISEPIKSPFGFHLIEVDERRLDKNSSPERMRLQARAALREKKLAEAVYNWQRELRDRAYVENHLARYQ